MTQHLRIGKLSKFATFMLYSRADYLSFAAPKLNIYENISICPYQMHEKLMIVILLLFFFISRAISGYALTFHSGLNMNPTLNNKRVCGIIVLSERQQFNTEI